MDVPAARSRRGQRDPPEVSSPRRIVVLAVACAVAAAGVGAVLLVARRGGPGPKRGAAHAVAPVPTSARARCWLDASERTAAADAELSALLAREAVREHATAETRTRLLDALLALDALGALATDAPFRAHQETVTDAAFSADGTRIVSAARDGTIRVWDTSGAELASLHAHRAAVGHVAFAAGDTVVVSASADATAHLWHVSDGRRVVLGGHRGPVLSASLAETGERVLTVAADGTARLWNADGNEIARFGGATNPVLLAELARDGRRLLVVASDRVARLHDGDGHELAALREGTESVERAFLAPDGRHVLTAALDGVARTWDGDGRRVATLWRHEAPILAAAFSRDGARVATGSLDGTVRVGTVTGDAQCELRGHESSVFGVAFAGATERLLTVSSDTSARIFAGDGTSLAVLGAGAHPVAQAAWSPAGDRMVTTSREHGTARLWDADGHLLAVLRGHGRRILSAAFAPRGDRLLTISTDLTLRVRPSDDVALLAAADAALSRELTTDERQRFAPPEAPTETTTPSRIAPVLADADDPASAAASEPARGEFAAPETCAPCHRRQYELWAVSAHARTFEPVTEENLPGDVVAGRTVQHAPGSTTFERDGHGFVARTVGEDGATHPYRLTHVAGRVRIRMFVATLDDGRMQVLPAMLEAPTGTWFDYTHLLFGGPRDDTEPPPVVAPGDASFWTGAVRSWNDRCAACHSSGHESRHPGLDGAGPRSSWRSMGVDCDSCHGPGRAHAEAWTRMETRVSLPKLERLAVPDATSHCAACHMEGDRVQAGFRPGADLMEYLDPTLLVSPERVDAAGRPLELIYDGLPFATSRCANAGGLTCVRCHDPHGSARRSALRVPARNRELCGECHDDLVRDVAAHAHHDPQGSGAACVACHMPFLTVERDHGAVADHTIGVPYPEFSADRVSHDACTWCHTGGIGAPEDVVALDTTRVADAYRSWWPAARGPLPWMRALADARTRREGAGAELVAVADSDELPRVVRATAALLLEHYADAHRADVLRLAEHPDALVRRNAVSALAALDGDDVDARLLAALADPSKSVRDHAARAALAGWKRVRANRRLLDAVLPVLEADVDAVPDDHLRWFRLGAARSLAGDTRGALDAYEHQLVLDPFAHAVRQQVERLRERLRGE